MTTKELRKELIKPLKQDSNLCSFGCRYHVIHNNPSFCMCTLPGVENIALEIKSGWNIRRQTCKDLFKEENVK